MGAWWGACATVWIWRGGVTQFPWLIFCFSLLVSWNTPGRAPAPNKNNTITRGDSRMRHRKEPGLQTSGRARLPWLAPSLNKKRPSLRSQICRDQSVPWVPGPPWPPSTYSNGVSWKRRSHKQSLEHNGFKRVRWIPPFTKGLCEGNAGGKGVLFYLY